MRKILTLAALCASSSTLYAQATPAPAAETPVKEKKVCRREETTGSIMPTRICHTKDEWAQIDAANARAAEQFNNARRNAHSGG